MVTTRLSLTVIAVFGLATTIDAQQTDTLFTLQTTVTTSPVGVIESAPLEAITSVPNAPFSADSETEFTQVLGDGNRIERRFSSMMARDSQGRTRREEEIALVGPLAVDGPSPRLVTILDAVAGYSYTLDERQRVAYRNPIAIAKLREGHAYAYSADQKAGTRVWVSESRDHTAWTAAEQAKVAAVAVPGQKLILGDKAASKITNEALGSRMIEGVMAEGTRTTSTIAAGAIGNALPIDVVTERWYSRDLQMAVLITRKDPRSGDSVYRLRTIVRAEPPPDLFTVPSDFQVRGGQLGGLRVLRKVEEQKAERKSKE
jgi:hypothetical protein